MRRFLKVQGQGTSASGLLARLWRYARERRGNVGPLTALLIVPLIGAIGIGTELTSWFLTQRAMQNAADSAAIAAATNGSNGGTDYTTEARSVAANYGFTNSANDTTVSVSYATISGISACASTSCYSVTIKKAVPIYFLQIVGYSSNVGSCSGSGNVQCLTASAVAVGQAAKGQVCLIGLGSGNQDDISASGVPHSSIACTLMSNANSSCNGHSLTSGYSDSVGTTNDCGTNQVTGLSPATDIYQEVLTNNPPPANSCPNGYWPEGNSNRPVGNTLTANATWSATQVFCGDVTVDGTVTITTASPGTVMYIINGMLDIKSGTLITATGGSALTIVFTSQNPNGDDYSTGTAVDSNSAGGNMFTGGGTLDINSPTSGTWSGIAIVQSASLPSPENITFAGNSPTFNISGVVDLPVVDFTAKGAVNKSTNGFYCFVLLVNNLTIKGTGDLFYTNATSQCAQQGVAPTTEPGAVIGGLVY